MAQLLNAGRVGRPHGLDGSFRVTRPRARLLDVGISVHVAGITTAIVRRSGTDASPILRLEAFGARDDVLEIRGQELLVDREGTPALQEDEWLAEDLEGLRVLDTRRGAAGEVEVGVVARLLAYPSCDLLDVRREGRPDLLVPLIDDCVRSVDLQAGTVDVDLDFLGESG